MEVTILSLITIALAIVVCVVKRPQHRAVSELPVPSETVKATLSGGDKIAAIRAYRKQTGASLLEASRVIDHHAI